jgi:hypothetical protein
MSDPGDAVTFNPGFGDNNSIASADADFAMR